MNSLPLADIGKEKCTFCQKKRELNKNNGILKHILINLLTNTIKNGGKKNLKKKKSEKEEYCFHYLLYVFGSIGLFCMFVRSSNIQTFLFFFLCYR